MKTNVIRLARFGALVPLAVAALAAIADAQQPFDSLAWNISAAESRVGTYRGRSALMLRDGAAWLKGSNFQNGTIEFDIAFSEVSGFPGIAFRAATHADYELFYLRQNLSGQPHATQYTPVLHGLYAWQIYAGPAWEAKARWTYDSWMHVKLVVSGTRAELYVDGDSAVQVISRLRGPEGAGAIGLLSGNGARFANFVVRPDRAPSVGAAAPLQQAAVAGLTMADAYYDALLAGYRERRDVLVPALEAAGFRVSAPAGAYYVMTDIRDLTTDDDVTFAQRLIRDPGVAAAPGSSFFSRPELGRTKLRFAFPKRLETLHAAAERLALLAPLAPAG